MLETPAIGANATNIASDQATPAQAPPERAPARRRPSDFQPNLGVGDDLGNYDPSRVVKKLEGSAGGNPEDLGGLDQNLAEQDPPAEDDLDPQVAKRQATLQKIQEQLESGSLKLSDFEDMPCEFALKNGQVVKGTIKQLIAGNLRQADYTRQLIDAQRMHGNAQNLLRLEHGRRQEWQDHGNLKRGLVQMGLGPSVQRMIDQHVQETVAFRRLPPERQQAIMQQQQINDMRAMYEQQMQQMQQQLQQRESPDQVAVTQHFEQALAQHMPNALKQYGLPPTHPKVRGWFLENIAALYQGGECTPELIQEAAEATAQMWDDKRATGLQARQEMQAQQQRGGALPARRMPGAAGTSLSQQGKRSRPSDFQNRFNSYGV